MVRNFLPLEYYEATQEYLDEMDELEKFESLASDPDELYDYDVGY